MKKFFDAMASSILDADIPEAEKNKLMMTLLHLKEQKINLMITGATGSGKSSTINALLGTEESKVGVGVDPETMEIRRYDLDNLVLWDTPGLGDGAEPDDRYAKNIIEKLNERDENGNFLIDLLLVILDGCIRDLGTAYNLINQVIIPSLGEDNKNRILIAINQADIAMKGRHWDSANNRPEPPLQKFLDEKAESVTRRIKEGTGLDVSPVYYCAGFKYEGKPQCPSYNLATLLYYIIESVPKEKRRPITENINCYITTATCEEYGKPDDCYELTAFRNFRDSWLRKQPDGERLIAQYYRTAPRIVRLINQQPDRREIYRSIKENYLSKCLSYIENGDNQRCKDLYVEMMEHLYKEQDRWH